jgi:hypothetical protein
MTVYSDRETTGVSSAVIESAVTKSAPLPQLRNSHQTRRTFMLGVISSVLERARDETGAGRLFRPFVPPAPREARAPPRPTDPVPYVLLLLLHQLQSLLHPFFLRHNRVMSDGLLVLPPLLGDASPRPWDHPPYSWSESLLTKRAGWLFLFSGSLERKISSRPRGTEQSLTPDGIDCTLLFMQLLGS